MFQTSVTQLEGQPGIIRIVSFSQLPIVFNTSATVALFRGVALRISGSISVVVLARRLIIQKVTVWSEALFRGGKVKLNRTAKVLIATEIDYEYKVMFDGKLFVWMKPLLTWTLRLIKNCMKFYLNTPKTIL